MKLFFHTLTSEIYGEFTLTKKQQTFAELMREFDYRYDSKAVFEDFLTMAMCAVTPIPGAGKSHYEELYLQTVAKYKDDEKRHLFPKIFAQLVHEMEENLNSSQGNDVLGTYYEQNFCKKNSGQFFTPWHLCQLMAQLTCVQQPDISKPQRAIDPCCGSGRMLVASSKVLGPGHEHYGIDLDHTCVKMTALNLFLNGVFNSEVMWADALAREDFRISYKISMVPFGIFRIEEKENSKLWHLYQNSFVKANDNPPFEEGSEDQTRLPQLRLF